MGRFVTDVDKTGQWLRRRGRRARRRMRVDGAALRNGRHTDGRLTVEIRGLGPSAAGVPETFDWVADRPIELVIVRSGIDGGDISFGLGPARSGSAGSAGVGDGTGIRYVAFCYDAETEWGPAAVSAPVAMTDAGSSPGRPRFDIGSLFSRVARSGSTG
jgi:hypothetical protein